MAKSKFSMEPPAPKSPEEFIRGATVAAAEVVPATGEKRGGEGNNDIGMIPVSIPRELGISADSSGDRPWDRFDRRATAKHYFNLRLNDYYYEILKHLANQDPEVSMQKIVKRILLPELERLVGEGK
jgi:hypothetical protein